MKTTLLAVVASLAIASPCLAQNALSVNSYGPWATTDSSVSTSTSTASKINIVRVPTKGSATYSGSYAYQRGGAAAGFTYTGNLQLATNFASRAMSAQFTGDLSVMHPQGSIGANSNTFTLSQPNFANGVYQPSMTLGGAFSGGAANSASGTLHGDLEAGAGSAGTNFNGSFTAHR